MKQILCLLTLGALFSLFMYAADEAPQGDVFLGYSFVRYNSAQTIPSFTANGGVGTLAWNFNDYIGMEAEFGGYHNGNVHNYQFDTTTFSYLFGPRLSWGRSKTVDPYIHTLFGGQYATTSIAADSIVVVNPHAAQPSNGRYKASTNSFAMAVGGGLDIKLGKSMILRPLQVDYYLTRLEAPDITVPAGTSIPSARNQNNFRYAAGVAFNFGGAR